MRIFSELVSVAWVPAVMTLTLLLGCSKRSDFESTSGVSATVEIAHFGQTFSLTTNGTEVEIGNHSVRLLSIADDGTTVLKIVGSGQTVTARVGEPFTNSPFGARGLMLQAASRADGKAVLVRYGADYQSERATFSTSSK